MKTWWNSRYASMGVLLVVLGGAAVWAYAASRDNELPGSTPTPSATASVSPASNVPLALTKIVGGLNVPWSLVFTSPERMLVTERSGTIRVITKGALEPSPLVRLDQTVSSGETGAMGLAMDPQYATNKLLYVCYTVKSKTNLADKVVRFADQGTSIGPFTTIIDNIPAAQNHAGCRIGFGPVDKKLYVTTGDAMVGANAQNMGSLSGKILRVNPDGTIPVDNPNPTSPVWSLGHRNPQGLAWQPETGQLFATEHGPSGTDGPPGGDEINAIIKGGNYGWPVVSHTQSGPNFISPIKVFTPAVAPSGATFYSAKLMPQFAGNLFFAALKGEGLYRVTFDINDPAKLVSAAKLAEVNVGRVRDVVTGPDGALYIITSNRDGRGQPRAGDDAVYRLGPKP